MAVVGTIFRDRRGDGAQLVVVEDGAGDGGDVLALDATYPPGRAFPPVHFHPEQEEQFTVHTGALTVRAGGEERVYGAGERFTIARGIPHTMANLGAEVARARWETRPALATADFHETLYGLRNDGRTDGTGKPGLLQFAAIARHYRREFVLARPGRGVQRVLFGALAPLAHALGYRGRYERYGGRPGSEVATIVERVAIDRPAAEVFAYVADYAHDPVWRAAVTAMAQSAPGTATVGTTTREVFRSSGVTTVTEAEIVAVEPGRRIAFRSTAGPILTWGERLVEETTRGALFTYTLKLAPTGLYALLAPVLLPDLRKRVRADMQRLKGQLEARPVAAPAASQQARSTPRSPIHAQGTMPGARQG